MSRLRYGDYSQALTGKTIVQALWVNEPDYHCLTLVFSDQTTVMFRFDLTIDESAEIADYVDGNLSNERTLTPIPVQRKYEKSPG
jgi:hypothetical protein